MNEYEPVIGLEIHIQLGTPKKMFCGCKNDPFESDPNTNVCPTCLGLPGAMPVANKNAIKLAQKFAHGIGSQLQRSIVFERKNYFYPDLPKGFQLTCPHYPISIGGEFDMSYWHESKKNGFREIHLEEDTAKSMHKDGKTWIDFNKSGVPLLEVVTEPDFNDIDFAVQFCKEMQLVARYLEVSEASMQKGQMRLEANISVRKEGETDLPKYRIELKNINSFNFMKKALGYELRRQVDELEKGKKVYQETRGYDENKNKTFIQRSKEEPNDYRYFPEPDIPLIEFDTEWLGSITTSKMKLPGDVRKDLLANQLSRQYVDVLVGDKSLYEKFKQLVELGYKPAKSADLVVNDAAYKNFSPEKIHLKEQEKSSSQISSKDELNKIAQKVVEENPTPVEDYKKGNEKSLQFLIGQMMKKTQGKADPKIAKRSLVKVLEV